MFSCWADFIKLTPSNLSWLILNSIPGIKLEGFLVSFQLYFILAFTLRLLSGHLHRDWVVSFPSFNSVIVLTSVRPVIIGLRFLELHLPSLPLHRVEFLRIFIFF